MGPPEALFFAFRVLSQNQFVERFEYSSFMNQHRLNLLRQRIRYLVNGNFHGVSANWLAKQTNGLFSGVDDFASGTDITSEISPENIAIGEKLFDQVVSEKSGSNFGQNFDCEVGLASFLYAFIISTKPEVIVETGVANGITTNIILKALEKTGGTLHSFDVDPRTKNVYRGNGRWKFHLLEGNFETGLEEQVSRIGKVDLWIHDSNHGYQWQAFEYNLAIAALNPKGLIVSDDIDSSTAWGLASQKSFKKSYGIFDKRKFFGVATI